MARTVMSWSQTIWHDSRTPVDALGGQHLPLGRRHRVGSPSMNSTRHVVQRALPPHACSTSTLASCSIASTRRLPASTSTVGILPRSTSASSLLDHDPSSATGRAVACRALSGPHHNGPQHESACRGYTVDPAGASGCGHARMQDHPRRRSRSRPQARLRAAGDRSRWRSASAATPPSSASSTRCCCGRCRTRDADRLVDAVGVQRRGPAAHRASIACRRRRRDVDRLPHPEHHLRRLAWVRSERFNLTGDGRARARSPACASAGLLRRARRRPGHRPRLHSGGRRRSRGRADRRSPVAAALRRRSRNPRPRPVAQRRAGDDRRRAAAVVPLSRGRRSAGGARLLGRRRHLGGSTC